jgi:hypothetical protein
MHNLDQRSLMFFDLAIKRFPSLRGHPTRQIGCPGVML